MFCCTTAEICILQILFVNGKNLKLLTILGKFLHLIIFSCSVFYGKLLTDRFKYNVLLYYLMMIESILSIEF